VLLVGTVVNNSILLVEFINQNKEEMGVHEAVVAAGKLRMRPILMTTLTTVVGMIPLALGIGQGGEMMAPMAVSVIGGLIASTLLTLIIIPCLYEMIDDAQNRRAEKRAEKAKEIEELERQWAIEDAK
jgi:HAE1 family hydrophobic/amphiphilic exporter-1